METIEMAVAAGKGALLLSLEIIVPVLAVGLVVGLIMGVLQAVTQIQEQMLSFLPKILAMGGLLVLLLPWILSAVTSYTRSVLGGLAQLGQ